MRLPGSEPRDSGSVAETSRLAVACCAGRIRLEFDRNFEPERGSGSQLAPAADSASHKLDQIFANAESEPDATETCWQRRKPVPEPPRHAHVPARH